MRDDRCHEFCDACFGGFSTSRDVDLSKLCYVLSNLEILVDIFPHNVDWYQCRSWMSQWVASVSAPSRIKHLRGGVSYYINNNNEKCYCYGWIPAPEYASDVDEYMDTSGWMPLQRGSWVDGRWNRAQSEFQHSSYSLISLFSGGANLFQWGS